MNRLTGRKTKMASERWDQQKIVCIWIVEKLGMPGLNSGSHWELLKVFLNSEVSQFHVQECKSGKNQKLRDQKWRDRFGV